ncbi:hypothetical protein AFK68_14245 [Hydrocoleum sp. CS-953]|uniref:hypothetical protein n=1 Tax=Hydrocoleum sp. CS-953 TaxID=1671698 RepID=UPI000B9BEF03|nr:hypothetical protein [Hydrocoleum sp. CS-953]OZH53931.1 hypothetical protein AFK68_14245 [Hydrocoleum sp. CS-953]
MIIDRVEIQNLSLTREKIADRRILKMDNLMEKEKFLLSLVYAIQELETPLSSEEKEQLQDVSEQLADDPTAWEIYTKPLVEEIISNNSSLNKIFQDVQSKLEKIDKIPQDVLPTAEELATVTPTKNQPQERPITRINSADLKSNEITNMCIQVISSPEPSETVKKVSKLDKLLNL